jgi:hypothetical protein
MDGLKDLAIAYHIWQSPTKEEVAGGKKHKEYVHTRDGRNFTADEWERICLEKITQADKGDLLEQIKEYTQRECVWLKKDEVLRYSIECLLNEAYKKWDDFTYQERLKL